MPEVVPLDEAIEDAIFEAARNTSAGPHLVLTLREVIRELVAERGRRIHRLDVQVAPLGVVTVELQLREPSHRIETIRLRMG